VNFGQEVVFMKYLRAAFRLILFFSLTFGIYGTWFVGDFFIPNKLFWRQLIFRLWAKGFVKICGVKIHVSGRLPRPPFFLVSNHLSYVDIPLLRSLTENIFVTKGEIESWFLAGKIVGDIGNIYINRQNRRDIPRAGKQILEALERGEGVIVFPEGTTSNGDQVLEFKSSFFEFAANANLPVYYTSIRYETADGYPPASEKICWWRPADTFLPHLWELFKMPTFDAFVTFGENPITGDNRKELAKNLRDAVSEIMK
jgi:1-acyl-sn-glycerol-3-phosphate acyltransferase